MVEVAKSRVAMAIFDMVAYEKLDGGLSYLGAGLSSMAGRCRDSDLYTVAVAVSELTFIALSAANNLGRVSALGRSVLQLVFCTSWPAWAVHRFGSSVSSVTIGPYDKASCIYNQLDSNRLSFTLNPD